LRTLLLAISAIMLCALPATAGHLLILQSSRSEPMNQLTRLIQNSQGADNRTLVLSDYAEFDLGRVVREERPAVIVAIGDSALNLARKERRTPVVYLMALDANEDKLGNNVTGVSMIAAPAKYMQMFNALKIRRVGVLYDPNHSGAYLRRAKKAAYNADIELVPLEVRSPRTVAARLATLGTMDIDAVWLLPDTTVVNTENVEEYFHFCQRKKIPLVSFAGAYLGRGALAALEVSRIEIGKKVDALIKKVTDERPTHSLDVIDPETPEVLVNSAVARRLELSLTELKKIFPKMQE